MKKSRFFFPFLVLVYVFATSYLLIIIPTKEFYLSQTNAHLEIDTFIERIDESFWNQAVGDVLLGGGITFVEPAIGVSIAVTSVFSNVDKYFYKEELKEFLKSLDNELHHYKKTTYKRKETFQIFLIFFLVSVLRYFLIMRKYDLVRIVKGKKQLDEQGVIDANKKS